MNSNTIQASITPAAVSAEVLQISGSISPSDIQYRLAKNYPAGDFYIAEIKNSKGKAFTIATLMKYTNGKVVCNGALFDSTFDFVSHFQTVIQ